jgi:regulator of sigma E protease
MSSDTLLQLGILDRETKQYSLASAFPAGVRKTFSVLGDYVDQFKMILSPQTGAWKGMGGFKGMAKIYGSSWDWQHFWQMTAMISIILAFMNLLPIPALDGGHVMFTLYEMIFRRKANEKFLEYAQMSGMIFLLSLMLYANGNDWFGWGKDKKADCKYEKVNNVWTKQK